MAEAEKRVGEFRLLEAAGRGGMGVVWRAEHVRFGVPAAVKLITGKYADDERYREQFRAEARAMACLDHENIARVLDYGTVGEQPPKILGVSAASPYLAMEWAAQGTLAELVPLHDWLTVRDALVEVLRGLAHAHARGVIHRDLKPTNVLVSEGGRLAISDFGLSRQMSTKWTEERAGTSGTPRWMAPEQILADTRAQGPWTDLYSLGCVAFWMLTYRPPYAATETQDILRGHLEAPIPRLKSRIAVPTELEAWLRRMLAKSPSDRYQFAADAAHDLLMLPSDFSTPTDEIDLLDPHAIDTQPDIEIDTLLLEQPVGLDEPSSYAVYETSPFPVRLEPRPAPPRSWAREEAPQASMELVGASLGLWGLRTIPMVDRENEREALWSALRRVHKNGRAHAVVLRGPSGTGKSRLAEWLLERAHELGAAHCGRALHGEIDGPMTGVTGMAATHFRTQGLDGMHALGRIRHELEAVRHVDEHFDALGLADLVQSKSAPSEDARVHAWDSWLRYLTTFTADRPIVLLLDDVQWGADTLSFVEHALATSSARILFVLTVREEALKTRRIESSRLQRLTRRDDVEMLSIEPLREEYRLELVDRLLRLDRHLARQIAYRTGGNPLFAVQLVDDWVERGALRVSDDGFELVGGADATLPQSIREVWRSRLERFSPEPEREALEVAAALGRRVDRGVWERACAQCGIDIPGDLEERLFRDGLAVRETGGWRFCHEMLRESIEDQAHAEGRSAAWHSACADQLPNIRATAGQRAQHLLSAGRNGEALTALLEAAEAAARVGDQERVDELWGLYEEVVGQLGEAAAVPRIRGLLHRARNSMFQENLDAVEALLTQASDLLAELDASHPARELLHAEMSYVRARLNRHRGESAAALVLAEQALKVFTQKGATEQVAAVHRSLGELLRRLGRVQESQSHYEQAQKLYEELGDDFQVGWCELGLGALVKQRGDFAAATAHLGAAVAAFEHARSFVALGSAQNELGEVERFQGHFKSALQAYDKALQYLPAGHADVGVIQLNLGLTHIALGDWIRARESLRRAMTTFTEKGRTGALIYIELGMMVCAAGERRWDEWQSLIDAVVPRLARAGVYDGDIATLLTHAGDLCYDAGEFRRAVELWELAVLQWEKLENEAQVEEVRQRLDR